MGPVSAALSLRPFPGQSLAEVFFLDPGGILWAQFKEMMMRRLGIRPVFVIARALAVVGLGLAASLLLAAPAGGPDPGPLPGKPELS